MVRERVGGYGLIQYPKNIKHDGYKQRYVELARSLEAFTVTDNTADRLPS